MWWSKIRPPSADVSRNVSRARRSSTEPATEPATGPAALPAHTARTPPSGPRLSPDVDRDAMPPTGSSTTPATDVGPPWGSRRPARHDEPSARVPNTDTDEVPTDTNTPRAPMATARSRHASAVYPFAMPPRSRRGLGTSTPPTESTLSPGTRSSHRRSPTRDSKPHDDARSAASTTRSEGAGGKGTPATYAARIALTSQAVTSGPISGLNAPPVASASASASRSSRSVSSLTTRPGPATADSAPQRDAPPPPPVEATAALSRDTSDDGRNTLHMSSWRATTPTTALTIAMPSPPQPMMSTRVPIAGKDERHVGAGPGHGLVPRAAHRASTARGLSRRSLRGPCRGRRLWWRRSGRGC